MKYHLMRRRAGSKHSHQRQELFLHQKGKCHWCGVDMTPTLPTRRRSDPPYPPTMCTLDHVVSRLDPRRRMKPHKGEVRRVAACIKCNVERGQEAESAQKHGSKGPTERAKPQRIVDHNHHAPRRRRDHVHHQHSD